jgi:hypothetical protein
MLVHNSRRHANQRTFCFLVIMFYHKEIIYGKHTRKSQHKTTTIVAKVDFLVNDSRIIFIMANNKIDKLPVLGIRVC